MKEYSTCIASLHQEVQGWFCIVSSLHRTLLCPMLVYQTELDWMFRDGNTEAAPLLVRCCIRDNSCLGERNRVEGVAELRDPPPTGQFLEEL